MNITYFLNDYPSIHKIIAHDEMIEMTKRNHKITVIALSERKKTSISNLPFKIIYLSSKINWFEIFILLIKNFNKSINHLQLLKEYLGIHDSLRFFSSYNDFKMMKIDRIHAHFADNAALKGMLLSKFFNVPFSCTGHGSDLLIYPKPYLKELIINSKPFITISKYNKNFLLEKYSVDESLIRINYCGIDTEYFKQNIVIEPTTFTIISVTGLIKIKGIFHLLEACKELYKENLKFKCIIIGEGEDYLSYKNYIKSNNLIDVVELGGSKPPETIKGYLKNSSIFVLPSLSEGIPVAVMEAMAMEIPIIGTAITGLSEIIENGKNGYLVDSENSQQLAKKIKHLYHHPEIRKKFQNNCRRVIEEKFNLKKNVTKFEQLITKL